MVSKPEKEPEKESVEHKSNCQAAETTLQDVFKMFYCLVRQSQHFKPGSKMSFDLKLFKTLPKKIQLQFERKDGRLFVWIPEKPKDQKKKKSPLFLPDHRIIVN